MSKIFFSMALCLGLSSVALSSVTLAQELTFSSTDKQTTLIELYTSQGCSSCPPADKWINTFVDNPDLWSSVVPLAYHVTYWDYLGWDDPYGKQEYSDKQRLYNALGYSRAVYTPGFMVNGREWRGWFKSRMLPKDRKQTGVLQVSKKGEELEVQYSQPDKNQQVHVALLGFDISTSVERGENRNRTLQQHFVVLEQVQQGADNGQWKITFPVSQHKVQRKAVAVWVTGQGNPTPLQATGAFLN